MILQLFEENKELKKTIDGLREALGQIERAACGEDQIAGNDTDGLRWIWNKTKAALLDSTTAVSAYRAAIDDAHAAIAKEK